VYFVESEFGVGFVDWLMSMLMLEFW